MKPIDKYLHSLTIRPGAESFNVFLPAPASFSPCGSVPVYNKPPSETRFTRFQYGLLEPNKKVRRITSMQYCCWLYQQGFAKKIETRNMIDPIGDDAEAVIVVLSIWVEDERASELKRFITRGFAEIQREIFKLYYQCGKVHTL